MVKRLAVFMSLVIFMFSLTGCNLLKKEYSKYTGSFLGTFNTVNTVVGYTKTEKEFNKYFNKIEERFQELHSLYDIYNDYEGINNIKTINDNAGIKPVKVEKEIIDLIKFAKEWDKRTDGKVNIAFGAVLRMWHEYREEGKSDPFKAKLPPMEELKDAAEHTDINKIIIDDENSTVYLEDKRMSLDVGAVAKGYATELVTKEIMAEGFKSGIINAGGNMRVMEKPQDGVRDRWGIGLQDPDEPIASDDSYFDVVFVNNKSVVSSGDYERFYVVNDKVYHHLIDPETLMPGEYYRAVTIVTEDSGLADALSTAIFLMPYEKSRSFAESLEGVEVLWILKDGEIKTTEGMNKILRSNGASGAGELKQ